MPAFGRERTGACTPGPDGLRSPLFPNAQLCPELGSLHRNAAGSTLSKPRLREIGATRERQAREPRGSASQPGARRWVPPQSGAQPRRRLRNSLAHGSRATRSSQRRPGHTAASLQPPTCSAEGTLPSIAATADARRNSSRQSRAIAGRRPPGRARGKAAARGGRRVPGRRCTPRWWLFRILSRSRWDRTPRSAAWAWAGVCARGAVRARVGVGVHVCACVYGRGGCVRACVRGRGSASWRERASACASCCHIAS